MTKFKIEQKVTCIDDHFIDERTNPFKAKDLNLPVKGQAYTIRDLVKTPYGIGVRLTEIQNEEYFFDKLHCFSEPIFGIDRFKSIS